MTLMALAGALALALHPQTPQTSGHSWSAPELVVAPTPFNGINGLAIDADNRLIAASVFGGQLWSVDRATGAAAVLVDRPDGQSDDVAIDAQGGMAWTSLLDGKVRYRAKGSRDIVILASLPSINSLGFDPRSGRLYAAQVFGGDALWELDPTGASAPRLIVRDLGWLNGFDVGSDGMIYGPLQSRGQVARIDPSNGAVSVVADGFREPTAVAIATEGNLWVLDRGQLIEVDPRTGVKTIRAAFGAAVDNLVVDASGEVFVSDVSRNAIHVYAPATGVVSELVAPGVAIPAGLALADGRLWIADGYVLRSLDLASGAMMESYGTLDAPFPFTVSESEGRLAVSSAFMNVVEVFDGQTGASVARIEGLASPSDARFLNDGSLVFAEYTSGRIVRASGPGFATRDTLASGLDRPVQMTVAKSGRLYVTEASGDLKEITLTGPSVIRTVVSGLEGPEGLAETPWGSLIVAETGADRLVEIDPVSSQLTIVGEDLPIGLAVGAPLPPHAFPTGVVVDGDGSILVSADENNAIYRFRLARAAH